MRRQFRFQLFEQLVALIVDFVLAVKQLFSHFIAFVFQLALLFLPLQFVRQCGGGGSSAACLTDFAVGVFDGPLQPQFEVFRPVIQFVVFLVKVATVADVYFCQQRRFAVFDVRKQGGGQCFRPVGGLCGRWQAEQFFGVVFDQYFARAGGCCDQ